MDILFPILKGLQESYQSIATKDPNMIYITTDDGSIYLGDIKLGGTELGKVVRNIAFDDETQIFTITYTDETEDTLDLALQSVIKDVNYNSATNVLTFTLVSGATTDISLADLVNIYTGGETATASADVDDGEILVDVKVSSKSKNALNAEADGLYVQEVTLPSAAAGKIVIGTGTGVGDSEKAIISEIKEDTNDTDVPDVGAMKNALTSVLKIGTF